MAKRKKEFSIVTKDNPALAFLGKQTTTNDVQTIHNVDDVQDIKATIKYTHINLRLTQEAKDFLADASWQQRMNITQYINALIEADMAKRVGEAISDV